MVARYKILPNSSLPCAVRISLLALPIPLFLNRSKPNSDARISKHVDGRMTRLFLFVCLYGRPLCVVMHTNIFLFSVVCTYSYLYESISKLAEIIEMCHTPTVVNFFRVAITIFSERTTKMSTIANVTCPYCQSR